MLYPAYLFVIVLVALFFLFWLGLILWAVRSGLLRKSGEAVKYKVFEDGPDHPRNAQNE